MDNLIEHAKRRAGILSASSAWGHDDDAALINQLLARIAELEDERDLWKQSEATCCARYDKLAAELQTALAMQTLLDIDGVLYDAKGETE